ncbi:unnamed protein product, partial [Discosporangium mesarthrocarpum]
MAGKGDGSARKPTQVFLRNLPLDMLEPDIETMLGEECGPVKRIDLIKSIDQSGAKHSRGYGFVTFALEDDARKASECLNGKTVKGRALSCEVALKKGAKREGQGWKQDRHEIQPKNSGRIKAGQVASAYGKGAASEASRNNTPAPESKLVYPEVEQMEVDEEADGAQPKIPLQGKQKDSTGGKKKEEGDPGSKGLSKKESRKAARKEAKKELVRKAKERAKLKASAPSPMGVVAADSGGGEKADNPPEGVHDEDEAVGGNEGGGEDQLDPKALELQRDAQTVILFGVADDLSAKQLQKRVKKVATITSLTLEDNEHGYLPAGRLARVVCLSKEGVRKVITKLDGHTIHGSTLRGRRLLEIIPHNDQRQQKQQRLIVRNLDFYATEGDLASAFTAFGPLAEVHIPKVMVTFKRKDRGTGEEVEVTREKSRGFGFVQFLCRRDAALVVKASDHGVMTVCGRASAVDFSVTKSKYDEIKGSGATAVAGAAVESVKEEEEEQGPSGGSEDEGHMEDEDGEEEEEEEVEEGKEEEEEGGVGGGRGVWEAWE